MKRILGVLLAVMLTSTITFAQGEKSLKAASKALSAFTSDFSNTAALDEAKAKIDEAFQDSKVAASGKSWNTRGDILMTIADAQIKQKLLNPGLELQNLETAVEAVQAYMKAYEISDKKGDKKNAIKGLKSLENVLPNVGVEQYQAENYTDAFSSFAAEIDVFNQLKAVGEPSNLDDGAALAERYYFAGYTGYLAEDYKQCRDYLLKADEAGYDDAVIYRFLFEAENKLGDEDSALKTLEMGREKYPEDSGLLFSEINYYLAKGELEQMISKLEYALEQEPDNVSVISTLGQVYDGLQSKMTLEGETEKSQEYFDKALDNFGRALELNQDDFGTNYSIGALYYNRAASFADPLNAAAEDFSPAGTKKYDALKSEMIGYFDKALPYFLKCDELDGKDRNTLIALMEIYVRKDMFDKSGEYKARLEAMPE